MLPEALGLSEVAPFRPVPSDGRPIDKLEFASHFDHLDRRKVRIGPRTGREHRDHLATEADELGLEAETRRFEVMRLEGYLARKRQRALQLFAPEDTRFPHEQKVRRLDARGASVIVVSE